LDIDARIGRLTTPAAATFPAVVAEISRKRLREDNWDTTHLTDQFKQFDNQDLTITQCERPQQMYVNNTVNCISVNIVPFKNFAELNLSNTRPALRRE
jgi:hypothetical protein